MNIVRIFHPVGQGAFYTERHNFNGIEFNVVYDCGSTTLTKEKLELKIKSVFTKGQNIDILFISHFHADHINGVKILNNHCKIKKVVIPLIEKDSKTLFKIFNIISTSDSEARLIDNPNDFFGDNIPIIQIAPIESNSEGDIEQPISNIDEIRSSNKMPSGTKFRPNSNTDWFFIPFNYLQSERKSQFQKALDVYKLTLDNLTTIAEINRNKTSIRNAYNEVDGDLNENSMILYSGGEKDNTITFFRNLQGFVHPRIVKSGCLYLGDVNLKESNISSNILNRLSQFQSQIGTLQVPHHGSIHNFNATILTKEMHCAVFSYGTNNPYGHPSDRVIGEISANNLYPHLVTEDQSTLLTQWNK